MENPRVVQRPRRLTQDQMAMLAAWVEAGPDPEQDGLAGWRRRDLQARIAAEFGVALHERTVGKQLATPGFRRLSVRPQHPKSDPEAQAAFKKLPRNGSCGDPRGGAGQAAGGLVSGVSRGRKQSGYEPVSFDPGDQTICEWFSRRTQGSASRARSPASGRGAAQGPAPGVKPVANGPASSVPSAPHVPSRRASCRPSPTPGRCADLAEIAQAVTPGAHALLRRANSPPDCWLILLNSRRGRMARGRGTHRPGQYLARPPAAPCPRALHR